MGVWGSTTVCCVFRVAWDVCGGMCVVVCVLGVLCENCIVDASIFLLFVLCFVFCVFMFCVSVVCVTGVWWMPWHAEPMKDV